MSSRLNTEFNYRFQVIGETPWEKIKTLKGFLDGRKRAAVLEKVSELKYKSKILELEHMREINALPHLIFRLEAELIETESAKAEEAEAYMLNRKEILVLEKLLKELYEVVEPTRIPGYTDDDMFEANSANEFTVWVAKEIQAEIIATGHPSPAKLRNAMSNPHSFNALKAIGLIPETAFLIEGNADPLQIELRQTTLIAN